MPLLFQDQNTATAVVAAFLDMITIAIGWELASDKEITIYSFFI